MFIKIVVFFGVVLVGGLKISKYINKILSKRAFTSTLVVALLLGMFSELIGLHAIVGAFLAGLFIQEEVLDNKIYKRLEDRVYGITYGFLGPIFFASLALYLDFSAVFEAPIFLISVILVAIFGKVFGAGLATWYQKIEFKKSVLIGLAMNSRGAVELIIASIGLQKES
jgi:Kef-type K+ transport system membrane component KefB